MTGRSSRRVRARALLLTVAAAIMTAGAIALYARVAFPWIVLGWVGLVPWLAALDRVTSLRGALVAGLVMCVAFVAAVFSWLPAAVMNYTGAPWPVGVIVLVALAPVLEPQFVALAVGRYRARAACGGRAWLRPAVVGAGLYVGTEWAFPKLLADTLGQGLFASALLRQAADLAGAHGLTFVLILANECILAAVRSGRDFAFAKPQAEKSDTPAGGLLAALAGLLLLIGGLAAYGGLRLAQLDRGPPTGEITAALVQANVSHYDRLKTELGTFEAARRIVEAHISLSIDALRRDRLDLLIWPETVYPTTFGAPKSAEGAGFDRAIAAFVNDAKVPLVFGSYDAEGEDEFNAAIVLEPAGDGVAGFDTYRKTRLFPFTEYLPKPFDSAWVRQWLPWAGTWKPGSGPRVIGLTLPDRRSVRIAPLICYDAVDPGFAITAVRQGAELLVTLSNDSWFSFPGVQHLILVASAFRSIETRRPQLRATPTGVSAVIDATGALRETIGVDGRGALVARLGLTTDVDTIMLAWGDWFPPTALVAAIALLTATELRKTASTSSPRLRRNSDAITAAATGPEPQNG